MSNKEKRLAKIAEMSKCDYRASKAMKLLREKFNPTYHWCWDWDGMVIADTHKEYECCTCR